MRVNVRHVEYDANPIQKIFGSVGLKGMFTGFTPRFAETKRDFNCVI